MKRFSVYSLLLTCLFVALAVHLVQQNVWRIFYVHIGRLEFPDHNVRVELFREQDMGFHQTYVSFSVWRDSRQLSSLSGSWIEICDEKIASCQPSEFRTHVSADKRYLGVEYVPDREFVFLLDLNSETFEIDERDPARLSRLFKPPL